MVNVSKFTNLQFHQQYREFQVMLHNPFTDIKNFCHYH